MVNKPQLLKKKKKTQRTHRRAERDPQTAWCGKHDRRPLASLLFLHFQGYRFCTMADRCEGKLH